MGSWPTSSSLTPAPNIPRKQLSVLSILLSLIILLRVPSSAAQSQPVNVSLSDLFSPSFRFENRTYFVLPSDTINLTSSVNIAGPFSPFAGGATFLDFTELGQVDTIRPINVWNGALLSASNLTLRVSRPPEDARSYSMLHHLIKIFNGGRVVFDNVRIEAYDCSYLVETLREICPPTKWKYNTTEMQILDGSIIYGKAGMALAESATDSDTEVEVLMTLTNSQMTCPGGGLQPPWPCTATFVNSSEELASRLPGLLANTSEFLLLSIAADLVLDPASWQPVDLGGVVLGLYGNPEQPPHLDFGGVAGAIVAPVYNARAEAVLIKNLKLLGLPYSPTIRSSMDFLAVWVHAIRIKRTAPSSTTRRQVQLSCDSCTIIVGDDEYGWLAANLKFAETNTVSWMRLVVSSSFNSISGMQANRASQISTMSDPNEMIKFTSSTLTSYSLSNISSARVGYWPLGSWEGSSRRNAIPLGQYWAANSSLSGPSIVAAEYGWVIAPPDDTGRPATPAGRPATPAGRPFLTATPQNLTRAAGAAAAGGAEFGVQYKPQKADLYISGPPVEQTRSLAFWDMQGVTGEVFVPAKTWITIQRVVLYNLPPAGALPYGSGFASGDALRRRVARAAGWQPTAANGTSNKLPAPGLADDLANLTLPLWYFAKEFSGGSTDISYPMTLKQCVVVLPKAEFNLLKYRLAQAQKLETATRVAVANLTGVLQGPVRTAERRRRLAQRRQGQAVAAWRRRALEYGGAVLQPMKADSDLRDFTANSAVSWYSDDTIFLTYFAFWRLNGIETALTYVLPDGAPTTAISYNITYDPQGYPPPSPMPPTPSPPSPTPPLPPAPPTPTPPTPPPPTPPTPTPPPPSLPAEVILGTQSGAPAPAPAPPGASVVGLAVGVSVGVSVGLAVLVAFILVLLRRRLRSRDAAAARKLNDHNALPGGKERDVAVPPWADVDADSGSGDAIGGGGAAAAAAAAAAASGRSRSQRVVNVANGTRGAGVGNGGGPSDTDSTTASATVTSSTMAPNDVNGTEQGLDALQSQAASAPTPAETMAMLAAAASNAGVNRSIMIQGAGNAGAGAAATAAVVAAAAGGVMPSPFATLHRIQIVVVDDDKLPGGGGGGGAVDAPGQTQHQENGVAGAAASGELGAGPRKEGASGTGAAAHPPAPPAGSGSCVSLQLSGLGKSLLRTNDIEFALQAYSSQSQILETGGSANSGAGTNSSPRHGGTGNSHGSGSARSGGDLASAISSLQAELSGRQEQLRITTVLGKGSFGVVYLGTWRGLRVAVKTLVVHDALLGVEGRRRQRAILEAAISTSLQHPNVVSTYAFEVKPLGVVASSSLAPRGDESAAGSGGEGKGDTGEVGNSGGVNGSGPGGSGASGGERSVWESAGDVYKLYIIQEYCDVGTLRDALTNGVAGSVSSGSAGALCALTLALDVACGMAHIHGKNIVHGDLSSANILLTTSRGTTNTAATEVRALSGGSGGGGGGGPSNVFGHLTTAMAMGRTKGARTLTAQMSRLRGLWRPPVVAKVADFGLSVRMGDGQTHTSNKFQGTPLYSAPEVLLRGHLTKAADVFSYGVMLLEFFYGASIADVKVQRAADGPPSGAGTASIAGGRFGVAMPASCPVHLRNLMVACLSGEQALRPTFEQVVDSLVDILLAEHLVLQQMEQEQKQQRAALAPNTTAKAASGSALDAAAHQTPTSQPLLQKQPTRNRAEPILEDLSEGS